jgi:branched-chain amino acid transport system substrate-binding protein
LNARTRLTASVAVVGAAVLVLAACSSSNKTSSSPTPTASGSGGALTIGTLLPQTGSLAFLGPPEIAGVQLAIKDINNAGGVNGSPVTLEQSDSGDTTTNIASQSVDSLLAKNVSAIIGAASSSVSLSVIDKITAAGVVQFSPANTSPKLTTYPDNGLYFRDAPPDTFQGQVVGQKVANDGYTKLAMLVLQDAYGTALAGQISKNFVAAGGTITKQVIYDPTASDFSAEVSQVKASNPEAIVLVGFDETTKVAQELIKQGIGPTVKRTYLVDGNLSSKAYASLPPGTMSKAGFEVQGTTPGTLATPAFKAQLATVNSSLSDYSYAPESYDAAILIALAAEQAHSVKGTDIATHLITVSGGGTGASGTKCNTYRECKVLLDAGKDINYEGQSGPIDFNKFGDPSVATMGIYKYVSNSKYVPELPFITGPVPAP